MKPPSISPLVIAPDAATARHMARIVEGTDPSRVFDGSRGWAGCARKAIAGLARPLLILAPAPSLGGAQLDLALSVSRSGGLALVWSSPFEKGETDWPARKTCLLLAQRGALLIDDLGVLACCARVLAAFPHETAARAVPPGGKDRISTAIRGVMARADTPSSETSGARAASVLVEGDGTVVMELSRTVVDLGDADTAARALFALSNHRRHPDADAPKDTTHAFEIDEDVVSLIAQPPARLLSETASKRLCAAFGIFAGEERLCGSPSEAVRFAADIDGPVLLKLVRPQLDNKADQDAVLGPVVGAASVRRAYRSLESLGEELAPPPPLGILVARHLASGPRLWLSIEDDPVLGRVIIGGPGSSPREAPPSLALTAPLTIAEATAALAHLGDRGDRLDLAALAAGLCRYALMIDRLDARISRADIHPLALGDGGAVALDATIAIEDGGDK